MNLLLMHKNMNSMGQNFILRRYVKLNSNTQVRKNTNYSLPLLSRFNDNSCSLEFPSEDWGEIPTHYFFSWSWSIQVKSQRLNDFSF